MNRYRSAREGEARAEPNADAAWLDRNVALPVSVKPSMQKNGQPQPEDPAAVTACELAILANRARLANDPGANRREKMAREVLGFAGAGWRTARLENWEAAGGFSARAGGRQTAAAAGRSVASHVVIDQDVTSVRPTRPIARRNPRKSSPPQAAPVTRKLRFLPTKATFRLMDRLGMGTVGVVYRAESPDIDQPVAVKLLHPNVAGDQQVLDRFEREVMIMERLSHPHIVRHYGGGILDGQYFYAMQLLDHGTLKDRIAQFGPLPWPQAALYADQIASALQHAHNHGIIHRDLKPSNLFFDSAGNIVLGDFGIARDTHAADISPDRITVGTYAYMSPEQICADKRISGSADLYSLGCVVYEMLTGRPPFLGENFAHIWDQHLHAQPKGIRVQGLECPEWLEKLVLDLLAKRPQERPFNARSVQGILRQHLRDEFGDRVPELTANLPRLAAARVDRAHPRYWILWLILALLGVAGVAVAIMN